MFHHVSALRRELRTHRHTSTGAARVIAHVDQLVLLILKAHLGELSETKLLRIVRQFLRKRVGTEFDHTLALLVTD